MFQEFDINDATRRAAHQGGEVDVVMCRYRATADAVDDFNFGFENANDMRSLFGDCGGVCNAVDATLLPKRSV